MNEVAAAPVEPAQASTGAGELLRSAREAAGMHIATLAVSLKVPVKKLEALEADRFDLLPDAVFVRALAASVCRTLKIDAAPILSRLPHSAGPRLSHSESGLNAPFRSPEDQRNASWIERLISRPALIIALVLVIGAIALTLLPQWGGTEKEASEKSADAAEAVAPVTASPPATQAGLPNSGTQANATAVSAAPAPPIQHAVEPHTAAAPGEAVTPAKPVVAAPNPTAAVPASPRPAASTSGLTSGASRPAPTTAANNPAAPGSAVLNFQATGDSWIEVTDAGRQILVRRVLRAGENASAAGAPPLSVVVGRADATQVQVRGKPFDLKPLARDNVARFEVR